MMIQRFAIVEEGRRFTSLHSAGCIGQRMVLGNITNPPATLAAQAPL